MTPSGVRFIRSDELRPRLDDDLRQIASQLRHWVPRGEFHHIGATAIPGAYTKGDVDVLLRVDAPDFLPAVEALRQHFAINQPENWTEGFASFADERSYAFPLGVQLVAKASEYDFFVFLVDYFTAHPDALAEYDRVKREAAPLGVEEYRRAKERFLAPILAARPKL